MKKKKIEAIIEASSTGFGIYADKLPGITGYGDSIEDAKRDIKDAIESVLEYHKHKGTTPAKFLNNGQITWVYMYDVASIFKHFSMLDATNFAKSIKLNPSLLRQYKSKHAFASDAQKKKIEHGLHALGRELLSVRL